MYQYSLQNLLEKLFGTKISKREKYFRKQIMILGFKDRYSPPSRNI